jgi:hypothetical protein
LRFLVASAITFTLGLIDRMSGPAKAAVSALVQLQDQLKNISDILKDMPKLSVKVPKLGDTALKQAKEPAGAIFGPGRKEAAAAAKYRDQLELQSARAAEQLDKQRQRALYADYQKQERQKAAHHAIGAIQAHVAPIAGADHAAQLAGTLKEVAELAGGHGLLNLASTLGAPLRGVYGLKQALGELGEGFEHVIGISPGVAAGIAGVAAAGVIAAAAIVKFGEAIGEWVFEGAHMALEAVEAKEKTLDLLEAMLGSKDAAEEVTAAIGQITKVTGVSGSRVAQLARELSAAGEAGDLLTSSMKAIAQAETVLPEGGAKLQKITERAIQTGNFALSPKQLVGTGLQVQKLYEEIARRTGVGVKQVEAQLKAGKVSAETGIAAMNAVISEKFGGVAAKQAKDLDVQIQRFHANISKLFKDVNVEGFLDKLQSILAIVDQSTESGKALHDVLTGAFNAVFKVVEKVAPYVEIFFLGLELAALKVANAIRRVAAAWGISFGDENKEAVDSFEDAMIGFADGIGRVAHGMEVLAGYTGVWETIATYVGMLVDFTGFLIGPFVDAELAFVRLGIAALLVVDYLSRFGAEAEQAGVSLVSGLVSGIKNAAVQLYDAVVDLAKTAMQKFRDIFQIHSPSRVMAGMGANISAGLAHGISSGARSSSSAMVGAGIQLSSGAATGAQLGLLSHVPHALAMNDNALADRSVPVRSAEPSAARGHGGPAVLHMEAGAVVIQLGSGGAAELEDKFPQMMSDWWERAALSSGTG